MRTYNASKVLRAITAAIGRGEQNPQIVRALVGGTLDGLPGISMSRRQAYRYVGQARERLIEGPDESEPADFLAQLEAEHEQEERERELGVEDTEDEGAPDATVPVTRPEPPPAKQVAPPPPTPQERARQLLAGLGLSEPPADYLVQVGDYLARASSASDLAARVARVAAQYAA